MSPFLTCFVLSSAADLYIYLSLYILNALASQPVLFWIKNIGNPSSKIIKIENNNIIGKARIKASNEKILSIKVLTRRPDPKKF